MASTIKKTLIKKVKVDKDFDIEIYQTTNKPYKDKPASNITPRVKIITKTTWSKMLFCEEHQQLTMSNFCCAKCEGIN